MAGTAVAAPARTLFQKHCAVCHGNDRLGLMGPALIPQNLVRLKRDKAFGDHHSTILDGDTFEPLTRIKTHRALHGGSKYSSNGRFVYFASRDGWISKFDMWSLQFVAEIRAGINTRNLAVSSDGRYVMVANYLPHTLVVLDAAPRHSFIAALKDIPEVWEIPYGSGADLRGAYSVRRIHLKGYLDDFFFDQSYRLLIGASRGASKGQVIDLDQGCKVATLDLGGMPHLGYGITWEYEGRRVLATPNLKKGEISVINMQTWKTIKRTKTDGPGFFIRSHENTPYAWVNVFFGPHRDEVHIIDKRTLEIVKTLQPVPGKTAAHVGFDKDGRHALPTASARRPSSSCGFHLLFSQPRTKYRSTGAACGLVVATFRRAGVLERGLQGVIRQGAGIRGLFQCIPIQYDHMAALDRDDTFPAQVLYDA